ncbi:hypothetical protein H4Q26_014973 [Puccinia striiformis f. sp. tritici PST-130]|nr:hypothetical protein H4Q26_014973 [Puccinia striiformis f. sp. tritici PST-130]
MNTDADEDLKPLTEEIVGSSEGIVSAVTPSSTTTTDLPSILEPKDLAAQITTEGLENICQLYTVFTSKELL